MGGKAGRHLAAASCSVEALTWTWTMHRLPVVEAVASQYQFPGGTLAVAGNSQTCLPVLQQRRQRA